MTDEEIVQEVRERLLQSVTTSRGHPDIVDEILSIKNLAIVGEGGLPENPYPIDFEELPMAFQEEATGEDVYLMAYNGFERAKRHMLQANFRRVIDEK